MSDKRIISVFLGFLAALGLLDVLPAAAADVGQARSKDGTSIAYECAGTGPVLLIVHGGTGDRTRWTPMFTHLQRDFRVCAMDRRAHGQSGDGPTYSLRREAEDVAAVVASLGDPVTVLGHSFGGVAAYEAAFLTPRIDRLVLYEPPFRVPPRSDSLAKMDRLIQAGDREAATTTFMREVVRVSPEEIAAMRRRPSWAGLVSSIDSSIRQHRALGAYKWDPERARKLRTPTLLLIGGRTASPDLRLSAQAASDALLNLEVRVLEGQEHNAMDTAREQLAAVIKEFMQAKR